MSPIIKTAGLTKHYQLSEDNIVKALNGIDLEIQEKEMLAILGPSGCGKSTLMHIIGLLDEPTSGKIYLDGDDVSKLTPDERAELRNKYIGFVFQSFNLLPKTSAIDNVELPLIYSGTPSSQRKQKATEALEKVGLGDRLNHRSTQLSGGQQQRVAIARALINNPRLVLADEPTGNLDSASGKEILELLKDLNSQGNTIIMVTHDQNIAKAAKRTIKMKDGLIASDIKNHK